MNLPIFELHTNEGKSYVRSTDKRLRKAMFEYIKARRAKGYSLASVIFCWSKIRITKTI